MTTLARDEPRDYMEDALESSRIRLPMIAADIIYDGAAVGESSSTGTFRPIVGSAGDPFAGFAKDVEVLPQGVVRLAVTGVAGIADHGAAVYALDDNDFTLTASGAVQIGKVAKHDSGTSVFVAFQAAFLRSI